METRSATTIGTAVGLIWAAALVAGCGGDSGGVAASCGKVLPCGGSLTGTWTVSSSCESATDLTGGNACPAATIDESQLVASGTLTFNPDMTFVANTSQSGTRRFSVPLDCLGSISSNCDEFASRISPGPPDATTTCTTMSVTCACTMGYTGPMTTSASGTYTTAGDVVTLTDGTGYSVDASYCVQGNTLHLVDVDATTGAITDDVVATK